MDTDRNLLFGVLALQMDFIDTAQFVEACTLWTTRKNLSLADLLVEKKWLNAADTADIERLLQRKLKKLNGDARAGLAAVGDDVKRSLAALEDAEINRSLADLSPHRDVVTVSLESLPEANQRYVLSRLHATGGIGRVWLARDGRLGRDVALKELRPERSDNPILWSRFVQEARITGQLEHPGIVPVYELGRRPDSHQPFYTMRFVKGRTLSEAARAYHKKRQEGHDDPLDLLALLNAFTVVCNTISYAHARGVIHRDLKGQNVILGDFGEVVVLDWGLAKLIDEPGDPNAETLNFPPEIEKGTGEIELTSQGQAMGTPAYMAPEQAAGRLERIGRHTDVYGLGAILYEILTGRPPFGGADTEEVLHKVRYEEVVPPSQHWAEVPQALEVACLRALAKEPLDRYASAGEFGQVVQGWQEVQRRRAEDALRESEAFYHSLVESLPQNIFRKDLESRFTFGNQRFCAELGKRLDEIVGKTDFDFFPRELAEKYRQDDQQVMASGKMLETIEEYMAPAAEKLYVHVIKTPIHDSRGQVIGTQGIFWDVTAQRAELELARERDLFHTLLEHVPLCIYLKDTASRFTRINRTLMQYLGIQQAEEAAGKTDFDYFPAERAQEYFDEEQEIIKTGQPLIDKEEYQLGRDGREHWFLTTKVPTFSPEGQITGIIGVSRDFTDHKQVEDALIQERFQLHTLMDNLPDNIYFKDHASRFVRINQALANYFGLSDPAEAIGKTDFDFFSAEHAQPAYADEQSIIRTGQPLVAKEEQETWLDGHQRWVCTTKMPYRDKTGKTIGTFGVSREITAWKEAELKLEEERNLLRTLIDILPDHIYIKDIHGRYLVDNLAHQRFLGVASAEEVIGKTVFDLFPEPLAKKFAADDQAIVNSGQPLLDRVEPIIDRTGQERRVSTSKIPLRDSQGAIRGLVCISHAMGDR